MTHSDPAAAALRQTNTGRLLLKAVQAFNRRSMAAVRGRGHDELSLAHAAVLPHIAAEGTRLTEIAERAGLRKQSVARLVDELTAAGYLARRADPTDRRASLIVFTARGHDFLADAAAVKQDIEDSLERSLGTAAYRQLRALLTDVPGILGNERSTESAAP